MNELVEIRYPFWQELFILLASTLTVMAGAAISPAMHELTQFFSSVPNYQLLTQLVLTITALAIAISAPIMGLLVDKLGRKPLLITSEILYVVFGTTGFYFKYLPINPTAILYLILAGRVMLGISVAGIMTCTTTLIGDHYKGEKRDQVMGYQAAFMAFGGAVFIVIAGVIARFGWNYSFLVYLFSVILLPGLILFIIEPSRIKKETIIHPGDSS
ncbi:MAG: MFS transporter, partial [Candidatus Heimdallarchaeota archaeon]